MRLRRGIRPVLRLSWHTSAEHFRPGEVIYRSLGSGFEVAPSGLLDPVFTRPEPGPHIVNNLFKVDHTEQTVLVSVRTGGEEQLVGFAIHSAALTESQRPKFADAQHFASRIFEL